MMASGKRMITMVAVAVAGAGIAATVYAHSAFGPQGGPAAPGGPEEITIAHGGMGMMGGGMGMMGGRMGMMAPGPFRMFERFDLDGDGKVTRQEAEKVRAEQLSKFDGNGDGALSLEEYQRLWLDMMRPLMVRRFQMHDRDGDGRVTGQEFGDPIKAMFWRMDANGDGVIERDELRMGPWGGGHAEEHAR